MTIWQVRKVKADVRYLDEQAGYLLNKKFYPKTGQLRLEYLIFWTWDWTITMEAVGKVTPPAPTTALLKAYVTDTCGAEYPFGTPSLKAVSLLNTPETIDRPGCGSWVSGGYRQLYDQTRGIYITLFDAVGSWDKWKTYRRTVVWRNA